MLGTVTALAKPMACFEREWLIVKGPSIPANITLAQVEQMIRARVPALVVKSSNKSLFVGS